MEKVTIFDKYPTQWRIFFTVLAILPVGIFVDIIIRVHNMPLNEISETITSWAVFIGVAIALVVYMTNIWWRSGDKQEQKSQFYLQRAIDGLDIFYDLLKNQNNDRVTWVQAARVLLDNKKVSRKITQDTHKVIFELKNDYIRHLLFIVLHPKDKVTGELDAIPPHFFYGVDNWKDNISIDDAARQSTNPAIAHRVEAYKPKITPKLSSLSAHSIVTIYEFLKYPDDYEDALSDVKIWDLSEDEYPYYLFEAPFKYLTHKKEHVVASGMCYRHGDEKAREREWIRVYGEKPPQ